ncbi:MAG: tryptophan synthase subunit alpha [Cellvibrionaceae bacterium]|nr:tryptophan synthase subunit alpha [Cellvibrionaceae bacterium]
MNRINQRMAALRAAKRKALVSYIVNGDPRPSTTLKVMHSLVAQGADLLELGIPFSDPMAEGPVIQTAHERALRHHTSLRDTLALVSDFRQTDQDTPIVLMGYANPIERMGYAAFANAAAAAGVDGVLTVDLPPEEADKINTELQRCHLEMIFLLAPTSSAARIREIVSMAGGFIYYVSLKGVTGAGHLDVKSVERKVAEIRGQTDLPVCVGFGIKDAQSAAAVAEVSDGVVVGSAIVKLMETHQQQADAAIIEAVAELVADIRSGLASVEHSAEK